MVNQAAKLSPAGERAAELYKMRQVDHQVSHRRDGKAVVGVCTCGFETRGKRVMDVQPDLDRHLAQADPDQWTRRYVDAQMKIVDRYRKVLSPEDFRGYLLDVILTHIRALEPPLTEPQLKQLEAFRLILQSKGYLA